MSKGRGRRVWLWSADRGCRLNSDKKNLETMCVESETREHIWRQHHCIMLCRRLSAAPTAERQAGRASYVIHGCCTMWKQQNPADKMQSNWQGSAESKSERMVMQRSWCMGRPTDKLPLPGTYVASQPRHICWQGSAASRRRLLLATLQGRGLRQLLLALGRRQVGGFLHRLQLLVVVPDGCTEGRGRGMRRVQEEGLQPARACTHSMRNPQLPAPAVSSAAQHQQRCSPAHSQERQKVAGEIEAGDRGLEHPDRQADE